VNVIAKKAEGLGLLYSFTSLIGLILVGIGIFYDTTSTSLLTALFGVVLVAISCYHVVMICRTPSEIITIDSKGILRLPNDVTLDPADLTDVSYKRARGKGFQYSWGEIILCTHIDSYKFNFVDDCESTAKELTRLMYESKNKK
jgi:hypothetical protein